MNRVKDIPFAMAVVVFAFIMPPSAYAYIDPGVGSYALQAAFASVFAVMFYARAAWNWLRYRGKRLV